MTDLHRATAAAKDQTKSSSLSPHDFQEMKLTTHHSWSNDITKKMLRGHTNASHPSFVASFPAAMTVHPPAARRVARKATRATTTTAFAIANLETYVREHNWRRAIRRAAARYAKIQATSARHELRVIVSCPPISFRRRFSTKISKTLSSGRL